MPVKKSKPTKKEKAAAATINAKEAAASKLKIQSKRTNTVTDEQIEASLHANLLELAQHSHTCFEFACKNMTRTGKGCVFWLFPDYDSSVANGASTGAVAQAQALVPPTVQYHSKERAMASEYSPVIEMIEKYDPQNAFVALVAIRTGDRRDSLMKVMIIGANTQNQMEFAAPAKFTSLQYLSPDRKQFAIGEGCEFCSNTLCWAVEKTPKSFAKCAGCGCRKYCEKQCQVMHWKIEHKQNCAAEKQNLDRMVDAHMAALARMQAAKNGGAGADGADAKSAPATATAAAADSGLPAPPPPSQAALAAALAAAGGGAGGGIVPHGSSVRPIIRAGFDDDKVPGTDLPSKNTKSIHATANANANANATTAPAAASTKIAIEEVVDTPATAAPKPVGTVTSIVSSGAGAKK